MCRRDGGYSRAAPTVRTPPPPPPLLLRRLLLLLRVGRSQYRTALRTPLVVRLWPLDVGDTPHARSPSPSSEAHLSPSRLCARAACTWPRPACAPQSAVRTGGAPRRRQAVRSSVRSTGLHTCSESRDAACALERHTIFLTKCGARHARARGPPEQRPTPPLVHRPPRVGGEPTPSSGSLTHSQAKPRSDRRSCLKETLR